MRVGRWLRAGIALVILVAVFGNNAVLASSQPDPRAGIPGQLLQHAIDENNANHPGNVPPPQNSVTTGGPNDNISGPRTAPPPNSPNVDSGGGNGGGSGAGNNSGGCKNVEDEDGLFAKLLGTFLFGINKALDLIKFPRVDDLVFQGTTPEDEQKMDDWTFHLFTKDQLWGGKFPLGVLFAGMVSLAWVALIYQVVVVGAKMTQPVRDPAKRIELQTAIGDLLLAGLFITLCWVPFYFFGKLNYLIVKSVKSSFQAMDISCTVMAQTHSGFLSQLAELVFHALGLVILAIYFMRGLALAILFVVGPLVASLWMSRSRRSTVWLWLAEVASNIFLQSVHALILAIFVAFEGNANRWWDYILFAGALIPLGGLMRHLISSLFNANPDHGAITAGTLVGAGALGGLISLGARATSKGISATGKVAHQWIERRRQAESSGGFAEGGPGGGPSDGGVTPVPSTVSVSRAPAPQSDLKGIEVGASATSSPGGAAFKGSTGVVGRYSPAAMESVPAVGRALKGTQIGQRIGGAVGAAAGGVAGAALGLATSIIPGGKGHPGEMAKAGADIGRVVLGGIGSAIGGATGMVKGTLQHHRSVRAEAVAQGAAMPRIRDSLRTALGYDQAPARVRTAQLAGGFVGSLAGQTGAHIGMAVGHGIGRLMNFGAEFKAWHSIYSRVPGGLETPNLKTPNRRNTFTPSSTEIIQHLNRPSLGGLRSRSLPPTL